MMRRYWKWALGVLLLIAIGLAVLRSLRRLGMFRENRGAYEEARLVVDGLPGPEDLAIDRAAGRIFASVHQRCGGAISEYPDGVYLIDHLQQAPPRHLTRNGPADFHPQGIDFYRHPASGSFIFAVNHRDDGQQTIEIFEWSSVDTSLIHRHSVADPLLVWPNDLVATGPQSFYVTNVSRYGPGLGRKLDAFLGLRGGYLAYFDGQKMRKAVRGLAYPNGIALTPDGRKLYVSETIAGNLLTYQLSGDGKPQLTARQFLGYGLDNVALDAEGDAWIAAHPNMLRLNQHRQSQAVPSPSRLYHLPLTEASGLPEIVLEDDGRQISGLSTALPVGRTLLLGTVCGPGIQSINMQQPSNSSLTGVDAWRERGAFLGRERRRLFYREGGQGPTLLLLPAFPTASWGWHRLWAPLAADYHLLAPDPLGSGFSDKPPGKSHYAIDSLVDDLEYLLREKGIQRLHLLANAYGACLAQELIARQGEGADYRIESVCFIGGGLFPEYAHVTGMQRFLLTPPGRWLARLAPAPYGSFRNRFRQTFGADHPPSEALIRQCWKLLNTNGGRQRVPDVIRYLEDRRRKARRLESALLNTDIPKGLINSRTDELTGAPINRRWRELLPDAFFFPLPGDVGHYPPLETPHAVLEAYRLFRQQ